jgi:hypothetical protein
LANDGHASVIAYFLQLLREVAQGIFTHCTLGCKAGNGPHSDLYSSEELLASHVPHTLVWQGLLFGL